MQFKTCISSNNMHYVIWHILAVGLVWFGPVVTPHTMNISHHSLRKNIFQDDFVYVLKITFFLNRACNSSSKVRLVMVNFGSSASGWATSRDHVRVAAHGRPVSFHLPSSLDNSGSYQQRGLQHTQLPQPESASMLYETGEERWKERTIDRK